MLEERLIDGGGLGRAANVIAQWLVVFLAIGVTALSFGDHRFILLSCLLVLTMIAFVAVDPLIFGFILLLPWYPVFEFDLPFHDVALSVRLILLVGVWVKRQREGKTLHDWFLGNRLKKALLVFIGIVLLSVAISHVPISESYPALLRLASYILVFFSISGYITTQKQAATIIPLLCVSAIGVALFGLCQAWGGGYTDFYFYLYPMQEELLPAWSGRVTSFLFHFNSLAGYLNLVLPFAVACMVLAKDRRLRILGFVCQAAGSAVLYLTGSRGGVIAYCVMLLFVFWSRRPKPVVLGKVLASLCLAAALVIPAQLGEDSGRLQKVDESTQDSRLMLWGAAVAMFADHPVLGVGYGGYRWLYNSYLGIDGPDQLDAHDMYLQLLAETGLAGFLAFGVLMAGFSRMSLRLVRSSDPTVSIVGIGLSGALLSTFIHGAVDYLFNVSPQFGNLFWVVLGLGVAAKEQWALQRPGDGLQEAH